tara:strand:+ start:504 stop:686 length:183 start_codon:yes stop_codon:yes gene_type:complete
MNDIKELLEELKEYRAELVHKNYPMGTINEIIMRWEQKLLEEKQEKKDNLEDRLKEVGGA